MRHLAIDLGQKRTGLAVGDDRTRIATPVDVIETASEQHLLRCIGEAIQEHQPDELVVGLPLNMDGSEGPGVTRVRAFADLLNQRFGLPVHLADERLTSDAADELMSQSGLTRKGKKARRDALAAAQILMTFWASRRGG